MIPRFSFIVLAGLLAGAPFAIGAQAAAGDSAIVLSIGDAARLAARQGALTEAAFARVDAARARVVQRRADLLPNVSALASDAQHTINSASFTSTLDCSTGLKRKSKKRSRSTLGIHWPDFALA